MCVSIMSLEKPVKFLCYLHAGYFLHFFVHNSQIFQFNLKKMDYQQTMEVTTNLTLFNPVVGNHIEVQFFFFQTLSIYHGYSTIRDLVTTVIPV